jgi:hypothetical protein
MSYRIFLSHTARDAKLAEEIAHGINNAFEGSIEVFLAKEAIAVGSRWKDDIQEALRSCNGLISLITNSSINKPWILIEWAAFWLQEDQKDIFILLGDSVNTNDLVAPMVDRQMGVITNLEHLRNLFRTLAQRAGVKKIPWADADTLQQTIKGALQIQKSEECSRYKTDLSMLPQDDNEKSKIAFFFLESGDLATSEKVIERITFDYVRLSIALELIAKARIEEAILVAKHLRAARNTGEFVNALISIGYEDVRLFEDLLEQIGYRDESEFTQICIELAKQGKEDTGLFATVAGRMNNMAELRKVAMQLIDLGKNESPIFSTIVGRFATKNRRELEKVGEHLVHSGRPCEAQLCEILDILFEFNKEQFDMLASKAGESYPQLFKTYLEGKHKPA